MTNNQESTRVYYLQQLCDTSLGSNAFKTPWGGLILKNCDSEGKLYEFKNIPEYKESRKQLWLYLSLKVFRYRDHAYPIFCCDECENMKTVENFGLYADPCEVSKLQCVHSKAGGFLGKNWNEKRKIELEDTDSAFAVLVIRRLILFLQTVTRPILLKMHKEELCSLAQLQKASCFCV